VVVQLQDGRIKIKGRDVDVIRELIIRRIKNRKKKRKEGQKLESC